MTVGRSPHELAHPERVRAPIVQKGQTRILGKQVRQRPGSWRKPLDVWTDEFALVSRQEWLRQKQPRLLAVWGKYDPSFELSEAEAYRTDLPGAAVHIPEGGRFALATAADEIASSICGLVK